MLDKLKEYKERRTIGVFGLGGLCWRQKRLPGRWPPTILTLWSPSPAVRIFPAQRYAYWMKLATTCRRVMWVNWRYAAIIC